MNGSKKQLHGALFLTAALLLCAGLAACDKSESGDKGGTAKAKAPVFSLAWSEYPSWSAFGVAHEVGLINGKKGKQGSIEEKWGVDIVLSEMDYDSCLVAYGSAQVDAVCITNMDALNPSLSRASVAILPTSTSNGADACIVTEDIEKVQDLKGMKVYGLSKTVSEYCFARNLEILGEKEKEYEFSNMDPGAAATAMQQKQKGYEAIVVWNPFVLSTLQARKDTRVLFDSTSIPGEILDMVVVGQDILDKPGGDKFASAIVDTFYALNRRIADPKTGDATLVALGEKFSDLDLESMRKVVKQTAFYGTAKEGGAVLTSDATKAVMKKVVDFCLAHEVVDKAPTVGFGAKADAPDVNFRLDPTYITQATAKAE